MNGDDASWDNLNDLQGKPNFFGVSMQASDLTWRKSFQHTSPSTASLAFGGIATDASDRTTISFHTTDGDYRIKTKKYDLDGDQGSPLFFVQDSEQDAAGKPGPVFSGTAHFYYTSEFSGTATGSRKSLTIRRRSTSSLVGASLMRILNTSGDMNTDFTTIAFAEDSSGDIYMQFTADGPLEYTIADGTPASINAGASNQTQNSYLIKFNSSFSGLDWVMELGPQKLGNKLTINSSDELILAMTMDSDVTIHAFGKTFPRTAGLSEALIVKIK